MQRLGSEAGLCCGQPVPCALIPTPRSTLPHGPQPAPSPPVPPMPPSLQSCPSPGLTRPCARGMRVPPVPPAAVGPTALPTPGCPPLRPQAPHSARAGQDSLFGGKAVRASAGVRHSASPTSISIWEGKGSAGGRQPRARAGRQPFPQEEPGQGAAGSAGEGTAASARVAAGLGRREGSGAVGAAAGKAPHGAGGGRSTRPFPVQPRAGGAPCLPALPSAPQTPRDARCAYLAGHGVRCSCWLCTGWGR